MRFSRRLFLVAALLVMVSPATAQSTTGGKAMQIQFTLNDTLVTASLEDNAASRDLAAMLPLTVRLEDHAATEKIADLPGALSTQGAPAGIEPKVGDLTYYAPWGNLALFHKDFRYSDGLVRLGTIDQGVAALQPPGSAEVTIELKKGN